MLDNLQIVYKSVKNINIKVKPTLEVILTVPTRTSQARMQDVLNKRYAWITKQLDYFKKVSTPKQELVSGESIAYLGQEYRLKITNGNEESVELIGDYLHVTLEHRNFQPQSSLRAEAQQSMCNENDYNKKLELINAWYKEQAVGYFNQVINQYAPIVNKPVAKISIRKMKTRWGSCNPKKSYINLNLELIKKHPAAIEYVVFHELTHLIHYNHNKHFYNFIATHMPDWQQRKKKLY